MALRVFPVLMGFAIISPSWDLGIWATNWPCPPEPAAELPGSKATCCVTLNQLYNL